LRGEFCHRCSHRSCCSTCCVLHSRWVRGLSCSSGCLRDISNGSLERAVRRRGNGLSLSFRSCWHWNSNSPTSWSSWRGFSCRLRDRCIGRRCGHGSTCRAKRGQSFSYGRFRVHRRGWAGLCWSRWDRGRGFARLPTRDFVVDWKLGGRFDGRRLIWQTMALSAWRSHMHLIWGERTRTLRKSVTRRWEPSQWWTAMRAIEV
jgi:hypothetical protein